MLKEYIRHRFTVSEIELILRKYITSDPIFGIQGVDEAAREILLLSIETDD